MHKIQTKRKDKENFTIILKQDKNSIGWLIDSYTKLACRIRRTWALQSQFFNRFLLKKLTIQILVMVWNRTTNDFNWLIDCRKASREAMFKAIDENNDGGVSFDEWLAFALAQYKTIAATALPKVTCSMVYLLISLG